MSDIEEIRAKFVSGNSVPVQSARLTWQEWQTVEQCLTELDAYRNGIQGACYACEPVGELNQQLMDTIGNLRQRLKAEYLDGGP